MAQHPAIMALRKRAKHLGYTEISIKKVKCDDPSALQMYHISAVEPLAGTKVSVECSLISMHCMLRRDTDRE